MTTDATKATAPAADPGRFVIITLPRSGSYHLVSLLNSAKDIVCHGEVFKRERIEISAWHLEKMKVQAEQVADRDDKPLKFLDRLRSLNSRKIFGFKLFPQHLGGSNALRDKLLNDPSWRKVFLFRNPVESYASLLRAQSTGVWVLQANSKVQEDRLHAPVTFAPESFEQHMQTARWFRGIYDDAKKKPSAAVHEIDYEDIEQLPARRRLLAFIGSKAAARNLVSDRLRQFSRPFEEGFTNWPEFESYLRDKGLADQIPKPASGSAPAPAVVAGP